ncbi:MAG: hypothetical protein IKY18_00010 [Oscillospiraceae bacterium]|nr:hypothetical protein [Oscillospiraceae bacterium]
MSIFIPVAIPRPAIELFGETKVHIERCDNGTYVITRCERVGSEEWRPVGIPEFYNREYVEYLYNVDLSQLE